MHIDLRIDPRVCTGCGTCVDSCPTDVIRQDATTQKAHPVYTDDCQACFLCVFDCPVEAITLKQRRVPLADIGQGWQR